MKSRTQNRASLLKRVTSFLMVLCMMCGFMVPYASVTANAAAPASYETITAGSSASVRITSAGSAKYFRFVPTQSGTYKFYSSDYTSDPYGALLDASGNELTSDDDSGDNANFSITYDCAANTTYYIKARLYNSSSTGSYTLNVETVSINEVVNINAAGGTNYPLFNSGRTESDGCSFGTTRGGANNNINIHSYDNGGYDIFEQMPDVQISATIEYVGCSFLLNVNVNELAKVSINAYDTDETDGESDTLYLVDETSNVRYALGNLSGMNNSWNNTEFNISPDCLINGHQYHFSIVIDSAEGDNNHFWLLYIRTVNLIINGSTEPPVVPTTGIENADLNASISSSGLVSVDLTANAYATENYTLEYKAVCAADNAQYGGKEYAVTIPTDSTDFDTTFQLESGSPRGTYDITVFIKDARGTVIATRTATASYGYSAVSYNANGGSQNLPSDGTTYSSGDLVTVLFDYVPSLYGYNFLGWSTDRNATQPMYTENGTTTFTIGNSDVTLYAVWGPGVCTHDWVKTAQTDPTCTTDGKIEYTCPSCGETKLEITPATGHNIVTTIETEVTCTSDGLIVDRCTNNGCHYEKRTVIHGEHDYEITDRQAAACETPGYVEYTCTRCGDTHYESIEGKHNYVESARVEAQVEVEGSITYTCTECGDSYSIALPALNPVLKNSAVLLIQNSLPWANDVNTSLLETLQDRGVVSYYNIVTTSALASTDLTQYGVVFIANDQTTSMYNGLAANAELLENYVRAGGNLIYGACDEGWGGCGSLTHDLPGGVATANYYSVHNYIVNGLHPIVTGVYTDNRSLADELLKGNYCSHTYFIRSSLPAGTDIILRDANGNPTLIEYSLGNGTVIASGLTWEYFYVRNHYNMVTNYSKYAYDDLVTYMVYMSNTCEHDYEMVETVEPTCVENGYTKYVCTLCSHEYKGDIVNALGHTPGDWIIDVAPTATQTGIRHNECVVCNELVTTEVMPALAKLVIDQVESKAGHTVRVSIDIQNNPGILGALLTIDYDPALTLVNAEAGGAWSALTFTTPAVYRNHCNFVWDGDTNAASGDGTILVLTFEVPADAEVDTVYTISASYTYGNLIRDDLEAVDMEIEDGSITVTHAIGDVNNDGVVDVADVIVLRRYLAGGYNVSIDESAADMNGDGNITIADVVLLRRFLVA